MAYRRTPAVQARLDDRRETVLRAAAALLAERGYAGCSVSAVAERAGIATGSVYQHFTGKTDLAVTLFRTVCGREITAVTEAAERAADPLDGIAALVATFAARALQSPRLAYALLAEPADRDVEAERLVFRRAFRDLIADRIDRAAALGQLPAQNAELTAAAIVGAIGEALVGPLTDGRPPETVLPDLVTFTLRALGGH